VEKAPMFLGIASLILDKCITQIPAHNLCAGTKR
jgi:hypothetical protein